MTTAATSAPRKVMSASAFRDVNADALWAGIAATGPRPWAAVGSESVDSDEALREEHARRRTFIAFYSYAVPTRSALRAVATFLTSSNVLEVCAGNGLWARLLRDEGVPVVATNGAQPNSETYVPVEPLEAEEAVTAHPECDALLLCWPPDQRPAAMQALRAFGGDRLVYIGDARFTGDADFHETLHREWGIVDRVRLPSWPGIDDFVRLYVRCH